MKQGNSDMTDEDMVEELIAHTKDHLRKAIEYEREVEVAPMRAVTPDISSHYFENVLAALKRNKPVAIDEIRENVVSAIKAYRGPVVGNPEWLAKHGGRAQAREDKFAEKIADIALTAMLPPSIEP